MNYVLEIREFYNWLELNKLSASAISLWHALMNIANKTKWQKHFTVAISTLKAKTGLCKDAIYTARKQLKENGLLCFETQKGNRSTIYQVVSFADKNASESSVQENSDSSVCQVSTPNKAETVKKPKRYRYHINSKPSKNAKEKKMDNLNVDDKLDIMRRIVETYENNIGKFVPRYIFDEMRFYLEKGLEPGLIEKAIKVSTMNNVKNWNYTRKILNTYCENGIKTIQQAEAQEQARRKNRYGYKSTGKCKQYIEPDPSKPWNAGLIG